MPGDPQAFLGAFSDPTGRQQAASASGAVQAGSHWSFILWLVVLGVIVPGLILGGLQLGGFSFVFRHR